MDIIKHNGEDNPLYVRNCWYVAAWDYELPDEGMISRTIINEPILLYRTSRGNIIALADQCCHRLAPLSAGRREGDDIRCMYHGLKYNSSGKCIDIPGQDDVPDHFCVKAYPVVEKDSWLWVWMGNPELADVNLVPNAVGLDNPKYQLKSGQKDFQANYLLMNDNVTDFSHLSYVHEKTFGGGSDHLARTRPKVEPIPRGIRISRWSTNVAHRSYFHDKTGGTEGDNWMSYDFLAPGILLMQTDYFPTGAAEASDFKPPSEELEPIHSAFTSQAIIPMTDDTTRYFFSYGPRRSEHEINPRIVEDMFTLTLAAFAEDQAIVEAQQRSIKLKHDTAINSTIHDRGPTMIRKVIDKLIQEERNTLRQVVGQK